MANGELVEEGIFYTFAEMIADIVAPFLGIRKGTPEYQDLVYKVKSILILITIVVAIIVVYKIYKAFKG